MAQIATLWPAYHVIDDKMKTYWKPVYCQSIPNTKAFQSNMGYETNFMKSLRIQFLRFDLNRKEKSTLIIIIAFELSFLIYIYIKLWFSIHGEFLRFNEGAKEFLLIREIERFWFSSHSYNIFLISLEVLSIKFISNDQRRVDALISISLLLSILCMKII